MTPPRVSVIVERMGPYHMARLEAVARRTGDLRLHVLQVAGGSRRYAWQEPARAGFRTTDLFPGADYLSVAPRALRRAVTSALEAERPDAIVVNGWGFPESRAAIAWAARARRPVVLFSDSHERDSPRAAWRERVKRWLVSGCASALVAGRLHAEYLARLGMPQGRIVTGYDVVDNGHFARGADAARTDPGARARLGLPGAYFLACGRFVAKKNLLGLVHEYAAYRARSREPWGLVLAGDGEERPAVEAAIARLGLAGAVVLPGFVQYPDLPALYGLASAFVLPSTSEQWGLVVNEAMAAGLPVIVSSAAGCAPELVRDAENGFLFDPARPGDLAGRMAALSALPSEAREAMGQASRRIVSAYTPETWADGLVRAVTIALERGALAPRRRLLDWLA